LKDAGIDKNLAHEARKLGSLSEEGFEEAVATARESISRVVKSALRGQKGKVRAQTETPRAANLGAVDNSHEKSRIQSRPVLPR